jgi:hypothetical protein
MGKIVRIVNIFLIYLAILTNPLALGYWVIPTARRKYGNNPTMPEGGD